MRHILLAAISTGVIAAACTSSGAPSHTPSSAGLGSPTGGSSSPSPAYSVTYSPADFSADITNPFLPLKPGVTLIYRGTKDGEPAVERFFISKETQKIDGIPCRVVLDRLWLSGTLAETTRDFYSQDSQGNVWYFGEDTAEIDAHGNMIGTEGTWHSGDAGAFPGIFMPASPVVGESHRQEYRAGHAEDFFQVLDLSASVTVPYRHFSSALLTKEWTPLEPGVLDHKYYVRGIGEVKESSVSGPREELILVSVLTG